MSAKKLDCRPCPECKHGRVNIGELPAGARCTYCHKAIEVEFLPAAAIPVLLAALFTLSFKNEIGWLGLVFVALSVAYGFGYKSFNSRYMPLKAYSDDG